MSADKFFSNYKPSPIFSVVVMSLAFMSTGQAEQEICRDQTSCTVGLASAGAGAATTVYSIKKFNEALAIEKSGTIYLYNFGKEPQPFDSRLAERATKEISDGDRVTIRYELNESASRQHHISRLTKEAEDLNRRILVHRAESHPPSLRSGAARGALRASTHATIIGHQREADVLQKELDSKLQEIDRIKSGGQIKPVVINETFDPKKQSLYAWLNNKADQGHRIVYLKKVSAATIAAAAKVRQLGKVGIAGAALATGALVGAMVENAQDPSSEELDKEEDETDQPTQYSRPGETK